LLDDGEPGQTEPFTPAEQKTMLRLISEDADRLDSFVESIVDLARIEAGDVGLSRNWCSVEEMIESALARTEPLTRQHELEVSVEKELPVIRVDARAVAEVIYTLIDNATKYAPAGTRITITAKRTSGDMVQISVADEGPGIPPRLRERVFDKFFHIGGNQASPGRPAGIGMGLSIAKGIVEAHDGLIWIADAEGHKGTQVSFTVPIGDDEKNVTAPHFEVPEDNGE
jgi:two-component system sensor histidine kinase KdpD